MPPAWNANAALAKSRYFLALMPPPAIQQAATALTAYGRDHDRSQAALRSPPHITRQAPFEWPMLIAIGCFPRWSPFGPR